MPRRSVRKSVKKRKSRRKNTRCCKCCKRMCTKRCPCKTKCKKKCRCRCKKCPKSHKHRTKRRRRRVSLKINERINMKKIQRGGSFKGIMRSMGLGDVNLAGSGIMNTVKGGYQRYIGGDDFESASPINQKLSGNITGGVVPDVPAEMATAAGKLN